MEALMSSDRMPSLLALRAFEAASRRLSFTEAARELHVSQAAVSRHVRVLEQELGRLLFRRLHRRVELTAPGKRLAGELATGFAQIRHAVQSVRAMEARRLRIAVEPAVAARWLLRLDCFPVIAKGRVSSGRKRVDGEVVGHRLLHDDDGAGWRNWFSAAGLGGYEKAKHLHFNESSLVLTAALRGQGVALSAPIYSGSDLKAGRLVRLGQTTVPFGDYWLVEAVDRGSAKARAAFVEWLLSQTGLSDLVKAVVHYSSVSG